MAILAIMLLFSTFSYYQGMDNFMSSYERSVSGDAPRPSIAMVFTTFGSTGIMVFGAILGLLMGFDLITREKETGSLKTLMSHPVFRDQIINGKALGAFAALLLVVALTLFMASGIIVMKGFMPSLDDLSALFKFGLITLAYLFTFFSIALFASTTSKNSSTALLVAFGIFLVFSIAMPIMGNIVAEVAVGPPPSSPPQVEVSRPVPTGSGGSASSSVTREVVVEERSDEYQKWREEMNEYNNKRRSVAAIFSVTSPSTNYLAVISSLSERTSYYSYQSDDTTNNLVGFILLPVIFFVIAYIKFLRMEIT